MIEASYRDTVISAPRHQVWDYVQDIRRWASLFPGCESCEVVDDEQSNWVIKVGVGGLVKTVQVNVVVESWNGPERVDFRFSLVSEPVEGRGSYQAFIEDQMTRIQLDLEVAGSGQMAAMWEAMTKPLLPQLAKKFASRLKTEIEACDNEYAANDAVVSQGEKSKSFFVYLWHCLQQWWHQLTVKKNR